MKKCNSATHFDDLIRRGICDNAIAGCGTSWSHMSEVERRRKVVRDREEKYSKEFAALELMFNRAEQFQKTIKK